MAGSHDNLFRGQIWAILRAQWRIYGNLLGRPGSGLRVLGYVLGAVWYGGIAFLAWVLSRMIAGLHSEELLARYLPAGLLLGFLFWQLVPLLMMSAGVSLDLRRLRVYPIPERLLFRVEILLRLTAAPEVLLLLAGAAVGLARNPVAPFWAPVSLLPFAAFNLFLSAGIRELLRFLLERKRLGEVLVFAVVLLTAAPQLLVSLYGDRIPEVLHWLGRLPRIPWPWVVCGEMAAGKVNVASLGFSAGWVLLAYGFGRKLFHRNLLLEPVPASPRPKAVVGAGPRPLLDILYRLASAVLPDPVGALVEKELRSLFRMPRFRMLFLMGFTFGVAILLPLARVRGGEGPLAANFLTAVCAYSILLLSDVVVWNQFGFDRGAAQLYFAAPLRLSSVLAAKNLAACIVIGLEVLLVTAVCAAVGLAMKPSAVLEALAVAAQLTLYVVAVGNLASVYSPRGVNPNDTWRKSGGKFQILLLLVYPALSIPVSLAFLARFALDAEWAFYAVWACGVLAGAALYWVARESAAERAEARREEILQALAEGGGLIG